MEHSLLVAGPKVSTALTTNRRLAIDSPRCGWMARRRTVRDRELSDRHTKYHLQNALDLEEELIVEMYEMIRIVNTK